MEEKKLKRIYSSLALALVFCLFSCKYETDVINNYISSDIAKEENKNFESISIPLIIQTDDHIEDTVFARIYDGNEYLPYAGLRYWLQYVLEITIESWGYSDGEYTIIAYAFGKSFPLVVNVKDSTIYCPAWSGFTDSRKLGWDFTQNGNPGKMVDAKVFYEGQKSLTFDLGKYGFKIYGGIEDAYVPICVLNQLLTGPIKNLQVLYNGKNLYLYTKAENYTSFKDSPWYADLNKRPDVLVDISYNLLCLTHDNLYGCPGYYGFADDGKGYAKEDVVAAADKLLLDELLTQYDPDTKALLKSTTYMDYLKGLAKFTRYTYGDQHASLKWKDFLMFDNAEIKNSIKDINANSSSGKWKWDTNKYSPDVTNSLNWWRLEKGIVEKDAKGELVIKEGKDLELTEDGKTLIIRFDYFYNGYWWDYYAYANENHLAEPNPDDQNIPFPDDTVSFFYKAFYYILHKSEYQNVTTVLIDLSCNAGGAKPVMQYLLYLITGRGDMYYYDAHTGAKYSEISKADLNLDGVVNDADDDYRAKFFGTKSDTCRGLNVAILTSFNSFSSANYVPYLAREWEVKIIGERSGGGSCIVGSGVTADGFPYHYSANSRLSSKDFSKSAEGGAQVDISLLDGDSYEKFFTNSNLVAALKELFGSAY